MDGRCIVRIADTPIEVLHYEDGSMLIHKNDKYGHWFVCTGDKDGKFYLQENYPDGEIRDIEVYNNICDALTGIAWAYHRDL